MSEEVKEKTVGEALFLVVWIIMIIPFSIVIKAWAVTVLWSWSLVPMGVPEMTMVSASMLLTLYAFIDCTSDKIKDSITKQYKESSTTMSACRVFGRSILFPPVVVGFAWVVKWFLTFIFGA